MPVKYELQNLISGAIETAKGNTIQTVSNYIRKSQKASTGFENKELIRQQETEAIITYAENNFLFYSNIDQSRYLAEGAEQKVYLAVDNVHVIKINDAVFYLTWYDYLNSLLLHNYFFPATAYELIGFIYKSKILSAVVKQVYVISNMPTEINAIKKLMLQNGFINTKNQDYLNKELGIILEDLHDENVLTNNNLLFFIDTVFYLTDTFYSIS